MSVSQYQYFLNVFKSSLPISCVFIFLPVNSSHRHSVPLNTVPLIVILSPVGNHQTLIARHPYVYRIVCRESLSGAIYSSNIFFFFFLRDIIIIVPLLSGLQLCRIGHANLLRILTHSSYGRCFCLSLLCSFRSRGEGRRFSPYGSDWLGRSTICVKFLLRSVETAEIRREELWVASCPRRTHARRRHCDALNFISAACVCYKMTIFNCRSGRSTRTRLYSSRFPFTVGFESFA